MARVRPGRGLRAQIDREISELDDRRARLVAARRELDRDKPRRLSQDDVAAFLSEHPGSTYLEIAEGLRVKPTNVAAHLNRGKAAGRFRTDAGKWSTQES